MQGHALGLCVQIAVSKLNLCGLTTPNNVYCHDDVISVVTLIDDITASADPVYNLLKGASMLSKKGGDGDSSGVSSMRSLPRQNTTSSGKSGSSRSSSPGMINYTAVSSVHFRSMLLID